MYDLNLAFFRRTVSSGQPNATIRGSSGSAKKAGGIALASAILYLLAFLADHCVQGPAHAVAVSPVLRGFARPFVRNRLCRFSSALFNQHPALLASGPAVPLRCPQRRN